MLPSAIKTDYLVYYNEFTNPSVTNTILTSWFKKASVIYWNKLNTTWGYDGQVDADLIPLIQTFSVNNPVSNNLDLDTDFTAYDTLGAMQVTFADGIARTCKYYPEEAKLSPTSQPTIYDPRYDFFQDTIRIYPRNTPVTLAAGDYLRIYWPIDFVANTDVPITDRNIQSIIDIVLRMMSASNQNQEVFNTSVQQEAQNK